MKRAPAEEEAEGFSGVTPTSNAAKAAQGMRRAGTIVRSPLDSRRDRRDAGDGELRAAEVNISQCECNMPITHLATRIGLEHGSRADRKHDLR